MASKADHEIVKEKTKCDKNPSKETVAAQVKESNSVEGNVQDDDVEDSSEDESPVEGVSHLDIFSPDFDPMAAIYSLDLAIPTPSASIMDNVESFVVKVLVNFQNNFKNFKPS